MNHSEHSGGDINIFWKLPVYSGVKNQHRGLPAFPVLTRLLPHHSTDPPHPTIYLFLGFRMRVKRGLWGVDGDEGEVSGVRSAASCLRLFSPA